ncbi:MAG TPA: pyridoxamine 5'-phosphate oxidase family protein [Myxococcota bacterium]|nr:pyridoxamine 5'-phosphate oxidase family protein [Myxococcota bacterium]
MSELAVTPRTRLKRRPQRGSFDRAAIDAILDEGFLCHVGFVHGGKACVVPTVYARAGDWLVLHGAQANRMLRALLEPQNDACVSVTHVDALVLARSAFHHSVNYRSVILYGQAEEISDAAEKHEALRVLIEHVAQGRWKDVRQPSLEEFQKTLALRVPITEGSAKVRCDGVIDDAEDLALGCWAGLVPIETRFGAPVRDPQLRDDVELPAYLAPYTRKRGAR